MSSEIYGVAAYALKYVFPILAALILGGIIWNSVSEYRVQRKIKQIAESASLASLYVLESLDEELPGQRFAIKWDNSIGSSRNSDICLEVPGVRKNHARISLQNEALIIAPIDRKCLVYVNSVKVRGSEEIFDEDIIDIGSVSMKLYIGGAEDED